MNFKNISTICNRAYLSLRKISPELALAGGIVCGVGAVVVGCIASRKVNTITEEIHAELDYIETEANEGKLNAKEVKSETFYVYRTASWKFVKLYAPTAALTITSIGLILASHGILSKRYVGMSAAYSALDGAFRDYRKRVSELIGDDAEKVLSMGGKVEKDIKVLDENGEVKNITGSNIVIQNHKNSPYEFDFNRFTAPTMWEANADLIEMTLRNVQNYANNLFNIRGHVFLNEVLDALGMERTPAGAVCGWIKGAGDDYIDFGYWDSFKHDYNLDSDLCVKNVHLNFNCDGPIWDMI